MGLEPWVEIFMFSWTVSGAIVLPLMDFRFLNPPSVDWNPVLVAVSSLFLLGRCHQ